MRLSSSSTNGSKTSNSFVTHKRGQVFTFARINTICFYHDGKKKDLARVRTAGSDVTQRNCRHKKASYVKEL